METFDAIVVGSGQAGTPLARTLAEAGMRTALVEREHVGGTCVNEGCTPTKTMVASARVAYLARRGADYGVKTGAVSIDLAKVRERKRNIVDSFRNGAQRRLENTNGLELIFGEANFTGPKTLTVRGRGSERTMAAERIFINAGMRTSVPKLPGIDSVKLLDNKSIMELDKVPEHLLILGGGYIGVEFGQMFRRFGSSVTIVQLGPKLLAREDDDVADEVAKILREDGIEVLLGARAGQLSVSSGGKILMTVTVEGAAKTLEGSHLLLATGRKPNSDTLNLGAAGIETDTKGFICSNDRLETNVAGVWVLGDIKGGPAFTHISYDDFRVIKANLLDKKNASIAGRLVPYTVFIDPQLGRVGLTEQEARQSGRKLRVFKIPTNYVARALEMDESRGFWKAVVDEESGQILGAAVLGIEGGEVMAVIEMAMMGNVPYTKLRDGVFAHPTLAEGLNTLFSS